MPDTNGHTEGSRPSRRERYTRDLPQGAPHVDPARGVEDAPPNFGRFVLPHIHTFQSLSSNLAKVYRNPDEAIKHSAKNAIVMRNDCSVMLCLEARQRASALLNWHLEPEDAKNPEQKGITDQLTKVVQEIPRFVEYRRNALEAIWYGRHANQHAYAYDYRLGHKRTVISDWEPICGDKLLFRYDDGSGEYDPRQVGIRISTVFDGKDVIGGRRIHEITGQGFGYFLEPWERSRICLHKHMIEDAAFEDIFSAGTIHGVGIRSRIYWTWYQCQETMAQLVELAEKTGTGFRIYFYPEGNARARAQVEKIAQEQGYTNQILMPAVAGDPDQYRIEEIPANTAGLEALKSMVVEFFGRRIKQYILGQNLTTESDATGLGSGVADLHKETFDEIVRYDSSNLDDTLTRELILPLQRFNFPRHRFLIRFRSDMEEENLADRLAAAKSAWDMGAEIKESDIMDLLGLSMPTAQDRKLSNRQSGGQSTGGQPTGDSDLQTGQNQNDGSDGEEDDLFGGRNNGPDQPQPDDVPDAPAADQDKYARDDSQVAYAWTDEDSAALSVAAAETDREPTEAQREAGNYRKGKFRWHGLEISIENPKGSIRRGKNESGESWRIKMPQHYGYIRQTESEADGDHVDVFVGPDMDSQLVFIVDQVKPSGRFDEHKVMIGWRDVVDAEADYLLAYSQDWQGFGGITALTIPQFFKWLDEGDTGSKIAEQYARKRVERYAATHAPAGYTAEHPLRIGGGSFVGGQFIPGKFLAKATPQEKAALSGKTNPQLKGKQPATRETKDGKPKAVKVTKPIVKRTKEHPQNAKIAAALASHKLTDKEVQRYSEEHNEPGLAKAIGGKSFADNEPIDVAITSPRGLKHGVELKTIVDNSNDKITIKTYPLARKMLWERKNKVPFHTVVFDDTTVYNANGQGSHDPSKRKIYYRRGYGSFRIEAMHEVKSTAELKQLIDTPNEALPKKAKLSTRLQGATKALAAMTDGQLEKEVERLKQIESEKAKDKAARQAERNA